MGLRLVGGAVNSINLLDSAVTAIKIATNAVTTTKILDGAVTTNKIADGAVTTNKILDNSVTNSKFNSMPALTIKGNNTGSSAAPQDLTVSQVSTLLLNATTVSFTAQSSINITGLSTGVEYRFIINMVQNTAEGFPYIQFNLDGGTNYGYQVLYVSDASSSPQGANSGYTSVKLTQSNLAVGFPFYANICVTNWPGTPNSIYVIGDGIFPKNSSGFPGRGMIGGFYAGSASLSSITFGVSAGTATGSIRYSIET